MSDKRNAKGEGSFVKNPDGTITHRKSVGFKADGKRKVLTVTATTKTSCMKLMKEKEAEWNREKTLRHVQLKDTVAQLCYKHLNYQVNNDELKNKSIDRRECTIRNQIEKYPIGSMQINVITANDIEEHIQKLIKEGNVGSSSIKKALDVLNAAFEWAKIQKDLADNPVEAVKSKLSTRLRKLSEKSAEEADVMVFSEEEAEVFYKEASKVCKNGKQYYSAGNYLLLLLYTGMRCGELIALRWRDVDWVDGTITIEKSASMTKNRNKKSEDENNFIMMEGTTKNQKARTIQLIPEAMEVLVRIYQNSNFKSPDDLIAPTETGRMNTASNLEHRQKVIQKNAGLEYVEGGLHTFRKTFATWMYDNGARVEEVAAYIGDLASTTRKYYIAIRKKVRTRDGVKQIVKMPHNVSWGCENEEMIG